MSQNLEGNGSRSADHISSEMPAMGSLERSRRRFLRKSASIAILGTAGAVLFSSTKNAKAGGTAAEFSTQGDYFKEIQEHENNHVSFLVDALGKHARPKPTFQGLRQNGIVQFVMLSQVLENTGVGAYLGAAPVIDNPDYLAAAGSIALIEARHAGYLNVLRHDPITGNALNNHDDNSFEVPLTAAEVVSGAGAFIKSLNGGPAVTYSNNPSEKNDIAILNFALALEYLESDFYNINVPIFF